MRVRVLLAVALCAFLVSGASVAFAQPAPSPGGTAMVGPGAGSVIDPATGASRWWYQDLHDTAPKFEGGYASFEQTITVTLYGGAGNVAASTALRGYVTNPHGGYDSTTNRCKVCHAVHRAEGAYFLLRANTQDDACSYCHIGGSARSRLVVYDRSELQTVFPANGHTIGASSIIPASSVSQETTTVTITTVDANMNTVTAQVQVRTYMERRNQMFRFARTHGHMAMGETTNLYSRVGPTALRCMSCHQPHNALQLVWRPPGAPTGYKLLRSSPSGSVEGTRVVAPGPNPLAPMTGALTANEVMVQRVAVAANHPFGINADEAVTVPVANLSPANTGPDHTIWTRWPTTATDRHGGVPGRSDPSIINATALSAWCADCHNLNIGYFQQTGSVFGGKLHGDRTHASPMVGGEEGPAQCYACHRNDMPAIPGGHCNACHLGTGQYAAMRVAAEAAGRYAYYDFPHSGRSDSIKLLGSYTATGTGAAWQTVNTTITANNLDAVCLRCHTGIGINH